MHFTRGNGRAHGRITRSLIAHGLITRLASQLRRGRSEFRLRGAQFVGVYVPCEDIHREMRMSECRIKEFFRRLTFREFRFKIEKVVRCECRVLRETCAVANTLAAQTSELRGAENLASEEKVACEENHRAASANAAFVALIASGFASSSCAIKSAYVSRARTISARLPATSTSAGSGVEL